MNQPWWAQFLVPQDAVDATTRKFPSDQDGDASAVTRRYPSDVDSGPFAPTTKRYPSDNGVE